MDIPNACEGCFEKQRRNLEAAGQERSVNLCPLLALLALNSAYRTPLIERHFLNLSENCATESYGMGGVYAVQKVVGLRAVESLVTINTAIRSDTEEGLAA